MVGVGSSVRMGDHAAYVLADDMNRRFDGKVIVGDFVQVVGYSDFVVS